MPPSICEGDVVGFWRWHPPSPGPMDRFVHQAGPRMPGVRTCARGIVKQVLPKQQVIVHYFERRLDVQISTRIIIGQWDQITDQMLFDLRMAKKAKARISREQRSARDIQFRRQLKLPF